MVGHFAALPLHGLPPAFAPTPACLLPATPPSPLSHFGVGHTPVLTTSPASLPPLLHAHLSLLSSPLTSIAQKYVSSHLLPPHYSHLCMHAFLHTQFQGFSLPLPYHFLGLHFWDTLHTPCPLPPFAPMCPPLLQHICTSLSLPSLPLFPSSLLFPFTTTFWFPTFSLFPSLFGLHTTF